MNKLLAILLISSICLTQEMEVDGDLKVTGTIQASTIDSLLSLIAQLEIRIAQLECQNTGIIPDGYCDCFFHTLDECGVCNGDTTTCQDCAGVPNGDNLEDNCGVCDNDSSNDCVQDCFGEWGGLAEYDICGICDGDALTEDECDYALSFDGDADYVSLDNSNRPITGDQNNFSILAHFSASSFVDGKFRGIYHHRAGSKDISIRILDNNLMFQIHHYNSTNYTITANEWYFVAGTFDGSMMKLYINGALVDSLSFNGMVNWDEQFYGEGIAGNFGGQAESMHGFIDDVSIWEKTLSIEEIDNIMNYSIIGIEPDLAAYWNFNESIGSTLNDLSGNGNHGTIYGATWVERE